MTHRTHFVRPRFSPVPNGHPESTTPDEDGSISSLPDLIRFNAKHNKSKIFCLQAEINRKDQSENSRTQLLTENLSYQMLGTVVASCGIWINDRLRATQSQLPTENQNPVALYMESDVGLFIYLAALLDLGIPVLLISIRLSAPNVRHLLQQTKATSVFVTKRTKPILEGAIEDISSIFEADPWRSFDNDSSQQLNEHSLPGLHQKHPTVAQGFQKNDDGNKIGALILHSSGTTGLPKPIHLSQRYMLGYAACHELGLDDIDWINLSTLPLYHGFGLLAPCLSLSVGMSCCFPPSSIIPAGCSTIELLTHFHARSLMTVPSIVNEIFNLPEFKRASAINLLTHLKFLAVGGGALSLEIGKELAQNSVKLVNHYGVTEIGAIAPIFCPGPDYDYRYLRLRTDINLSLRSLPGSDKCKLVGYPIGWDEQFEVQDEIERKPDTSRLEVRILGRTDDVIVLRSGEKVMPRHLETALMADSFVQAAVCVGTGWFEVLVLIEPSTTAPKDPMRLRSHIWALVSNINKSLDQHGRLSSEKAIIIKPEDKSIPRSDKGSIMRHEVMERFKQNIESAYAELGEHATGIEVYIDVEDIQSSIRRLLSLVAGEWLHGASAKALSSSDDFFERGMDSLQAVRLARFINAAIDKHIPAWTTKYGIGAEFIYANPSVQRLGAGIKHLIQREGYVYDDNIRERTSEMRRVLAGLFDNIPLRINPTTTTESVVLLTGATGNLGAHVLGQLVRYRSVKEVHCLVRENSNGDSSQDRITKALLAAGIALHSSQWKKIELHESHPSLWPAEHNDTHDTSESWPKFASKLTHIMHLAWPMGFSRTLQSFQPQLETVKRLVDLAQVAVASQPTVRVRLIFASSIAVVRHFSDISNKLKDPVPEVELEDPQVTTPMGYAEAKWVCERMLARVSRDIANIDPVVVRIGQISGPERHDGAWNSTEHIPALLRASQLIGKLPALTGTVSWLPVDRTAEILIEMLLHRGAIGKFLHLENPVRQPTADILTIMGGQLGLSDSLIPFEQWLQLAIRSGAIPSLEGFFEHHFRAMACGSVVLDTRRARAASSVLRGSSGLSRDLLVRYISRWKEEGFLL